MSDVVIPGVHGHSADLAFGPFTHRQAITHTARAVGWSDAWTCVWKADGRMQNFFRESTLVALRQPAFPSFAAPDPETAMLIGSAKRVSDFLGAECFAAAVQRGMGVWAHETEESCGAKYDT